MLHCANRDYTESGLIEVTKQMKVCVEEKDCGTKVTVSEFQTPYTITTECPKPIDPTNINPEWMWEDFGGFDTGYLTTEEEALLA